MYARIIKITFQNEFARKGAEALLNPMVFQEAKEYGLIYRITLNPKPEQRIAIQIYDEEKSAKTFLRKFGDGKLNEIRDTGARVEVFEGLIDKFDHLLEN